MKKKFKTCVLTAVLVSAMTLSALPVYAAGNTLNTDNTNNYTTVKYEVAETYTVNIPDLVTFTSATENPTQEISASKVKINFGKTLKVKVSSANYGDNSFRMKDGDNEEYLKYVIKKGADDSVGLTNDAIVLSVPAGTDTGNVTLNYSIPTPPTKAGSYVDKLTFTTSVE